MISSVVRHFTHGANDDLPSHPRMISKDQISFLRKMLNDELDELEEAKNVIQFADALLDIIYYVVDQGLRHGVNLDNLFLHVHSANMRKRFPDGTFHKREDGKVIKPEGWRGPDLDLANEMIEQILHGSFTEYNTYMDHWYIVSPYTHDDPQVLQDRYNSASELAAYLINSEKIVYSPISSWHDIASRFSLPVEFTFWRRLNYYYIRTGRGIIVSMISGWNRSVGVLSEINYAQIMGKEIIYAKRNEDGSFSFYNNPGMEREVDIQKI